MPNLAPLSHSAPPARHARTIRAERSADARPDGALWRGPTGNLDLRSCRYGTS
jgi:hypothetical protein